MTRLLNKDYLGREFDVLLFDCNREITTKSLSESLNFEFESFDDSSCFYLFPGVFCVITVRSDWGKFQSDETNGVTNTALIKVLLHSDAIVIFH